MSYTLKMFNTGQVTLPKKWRSKYDTDNFLAEEKDGTLIITPIFPVKKDTSVYYEDEHGFGVYFPEGVDPKELISDIEKYIDDN